MKAGIYRAVRRTREGIWVIGEHAGSRVTGNDIGGSAGELVQKIHPLMQDTVTGTQKNKGNQSSSYLAPAPVSIHGGWGRTRAYEARQRSLVQSCLVFWTIGSHYRLLREGVIFWNDLLFQHVFERSKWCRPAFAHIPNLVFRCCGLPVLTQLGVGFVKF